MKHLITRIRNIIRWIPFLWEDRDWDYSYIDKILLVKIRHMRQRTEKLKMFVGYEINVKWMRICENLLENLIEGVYWDDKYDNAPLNIRNMKFNCQCDYYINNAKNHASGFPSEIREIKARRLLYKILDYKITHWWD